MNANHSHDVYTSPPEPPSLEMIGAIYNALTPDITNACVRMANAFKAMRSEHLGNAVRRRILVPGLDGKPDATVLFVSFIDGQAEVSAEYVASDRPLARPERYDSTLVSISFPSQEPEASAAPAEIENIADFAIAALHASSDAGTLQRNWLTIEQCERIICPDDESETGQHRDFKVPFRISFFQKPDGGMAPVAKGDSVRLSEAERTELQWVASILSRAAQTAGATYEQLSVPADPLRDTVTPIIAK